MRPDDLQRLHEAATPGPWESIHADENTGLPLVLGSDCHEIANVYPHRKGPATLANADLIATTCNLTPLVVALWKAAEMFQSAYDAQQLDWSDRENLRDALSALSAFDAGE